ncbi:MAG: M60 family metallopeptidase [Marinilabilia sp.]
MKITSGNLIPENLFQNSQGIENSFDGKTNTFYHSPWKGMEKDQNLTLVYHIDASKQDTLHYIKLFPRPQGNNGIIKTATLWGKSSSKKYKKLADIDAPKRNRPLIIKLSNPIPNPQKIKIQVKDAYSGDEAYYVSLAEIGCFMSNSYMPDPAERSLFTGNTFSSLKEGISKEEISKITNPFIRNMAHYLSENTYPLEQRMQSYEPYRDVHDLAEELKTSTYNQFENPTGIYFQKGEDAVLFVNKPDGEEIFLRVKDFGPSGDDNSYRVKDGINVIPMKGRGNGYINYFTENFEEGSSAKINIASGQVNGYFDKNRHTNKDGMKILDNATNGILDIVGDHVQLAYSVESLKENSYKQLHDLISIYDSIVGSQQRLMGLMKYTRQPENRILGRVIWDGYMHADALGAAFHDNTMSTIANPEKLKNNIWGPAHEFGHVNQVRPGMTWVGTTECTNNIYSAWTQYCFTPNQLRLEHENIGGTIGGRFNAYLNNALVKDQEWGLQEGPDTNYGAKDGKWGGDHFVKLCPLWQLHLFFHVAGKGNDWHRPNFWADIFESVRNTDEKDLSQGELQMNFIKNTCDAVEYDLTNFFTSIGMLQEVDKVFDDYTSARKIITSEMIKEIEHYAAQYPSPPVNTIQYISGNSIEAFRKTKEIKGEYGKGLSFSDPKKIKVNHNEWENITVFKTYRNNTLTHITMVGTGSPNRNEFTMVPFPEGSTKVKAISYNGKEKMVYDEAN